MSEATREPNAPADVLAIGLGPFNLGLTALSEPLNLDVRVLEARDHFTWHPGMMVERATIQVPFMADLVTMADPTSPYSFLNYLKQAERLYPFYIRESFNPLRREYNAYCQWVAEHLRAHIRYEHRVTALRYDAKSDLFEATCEVAGGTVIERGRHVVVGVGTAPFVPEALNPLGDLAHHSADYMNVRDDLLDAGRVAVVGSGQSAAEAFHDLLTARGRRGHLTWLTRSPRFFPMEYTKLTLELTSPEYIDHFHSLDESRRDTLLREQRNLYKGISADLINTIHETLYQQSLEGPTGVTLAANVAVVDSSLTPDGTAQLRLREGDSGAESVVEADVVLAATGYRSVAPALLQNLPGVMFDASGRPEVTRDYAVDGARRRVFIQNGEEHTHSLTAPDLGMGAYRNSVILREIMGHEVYPIEKSIAYQTFGVPA